MQEDKNANKAGKCRSRAKKTEGEEQGMNREKLRRVGAFDVVNSGVRVCSNSHD